MIGPRILQSVLLMALLAASSAQATVVTFDFEDVTPASNLTSLTLTKGGLTVEILHPNFRVFNFSDPEYNALQAVLDDTQFVVNFSQAVNGFTVGIGDDGQDEDVGTLQAFAGVGATGLLLGSDTATLPNTGISDFTGDTMTVSALGIRSVAFDSEGVQGQSVRWDNFVVTFDVAEPTTLFLMSLGLASVGYRRHRNTNFV